MIAFNRVKKFEERWHFFFIILIQFLRFINDCPTDIYFLSHPKNEKMDESDQNCFRIKFKF